MGNASIAFRVDRFIAQYHNSIIETISLYNNEFNWGEVTSNYYTIQGYYLIRLINEPTLLVIQYQKQGNNQAFEMELTQFHLEYLEPLKAYLWDYGV
jgi:hypothetical protein